MTSWHRPVQFNRFVEVVKRHRNMEMLKTHTFNFQILREQVENQKFGTFGVFRNQDF